jgi:hypothetical protein
MNSMKSLLVLLLCTVPALAQVKQSGNVTPGHVSTWTTNGVIQDGGTPQNPKITGGLGVVSTNQESVCTQNALTNYTQLCLGVTNSGAYLTETQFGGGTLPFHFVINGQDYPFPGPTGPFLPLGGGVMVGTIGQVISPTWVGGWPPTSPLGIQFTQTFTGTPSGGYHDPSGGQQIPLNFINVSESLTYDPSASYVNAFSVRHQFGGSGTTGARTAVLIDLESVGPFVTTGFGQYSAAQFSTLANYNMTGSTAISPKGNYYGWNMYISAEANSTIDGSPIYVQGLGGFEMDYTIAAGGSVFSGVGILIANLTAAGTTETNNGTGIAIATAFDNTSGTVGFKSNAIFFGNQSGGHHLPIQSTGSLIGANPGTVVNGTDYSAVTFTGCAFKGPASFCVDAGNFVHTDAVQSATTNAISYRTSAGDALFSMGKTGTPTNYIASIATQTGTDPVFTAVSSSGANVNMEIRGGGTSGTTSGVVLKSGAVLAIAEFSGVASAIYSLNVTSAASGNNVLVDINSTASGMSIGASNANAVVLGRTAGALGFYGASAISKATPSGACAGNTGCQALRDSIGNLGFINTGSITN